MPEIKVAQPSFILPFHASYAKLGEVAKPPKPNRFQVSATVSLEIFLPGSALCTLILLPSLFDSAPPY